MKYFLFTISITLLSLQSCSKDSCDCIVTNTSSDGTITTREIIYYEGEKGRTSKEHCDNFHVAYSGTYTDPTTGMTTVSKTNCKLNN